MRVIVMKVSLKADWAHSLKEKRMVVKSIIAKLQNKFNISVGEIENQDIHNLITIGIAGIALDAKVCDSTIENIINYRRNYRCRNYKYRTRSEYILIKTSL